MKMGITNLLLIFPIVIALLAGTWTLATWNTDKTIEQKEERIRLLSDKLKICEEAYNIKQDVTQLETHNLSSDTYNLQLGKTLYAKDNMIQIMLVNAYDRGVDLNVNGFKAFLNRGEATIALANGKIFFIKLTKYTLHGDKIGDVEVTVYSQK